jgi:glycosyltransferase involved in cell wall biosynthesis
MKTLLASMAPFLGGAEVALARLAVGLQARGQDVVVVLGTRGEVSKRLEAGGVRCMHSPMCLTDRWHWWRYSQARRQLRQLLLRERPQIVHSNDLPTHQMVSDAARGCGAPRVCHHRFTYEGACLDWLNKFGAEKHLFISHSLKEELTSRSRRLRDSGGAVLYDGIPIAGRPTPCDWLRARVELGLPRDRVVVLFAGQVVEVKGVADLLHAWALLPGTAKERAELVIVGEDLQAAGAYRLRMEALAREIGCRARFAGFQPDVHVWQLAADVAVVPSHVEPLGLVALEAMSWTRPVVGCSVGGIRETVVDGVTGLLVPPRSPQALAGALARLIADEALRAAFGQAGRKRCEQLFSLECHVDNVIAEYRKLVRSRDGRSAVPLLS